MDSKQEVLEAIRQRFGLDDEDSSRDDEIFSLTSIEKLREVVAWNLGDKRWADQLLEWASACGLEIKP